MKKLLFCLIPLTLMIWSCETEPLDPVIEVGQMPEDPDDILTARVDGDTLEINATTSAFSGGLISISGTDDNGAGVTVTVRETAMTGSYTLPDSSNAITIGYSSASTSYTTTSGTATIASNDVTMDLISGSFNVTMTDPSGAEPDVTVQGNFSVSY